MTDNTSTDLDAIRDRVQVRGEVKEYRATREQLDAEALVAEVQRLREGIRHVREDLDRYVNAGREVTPADHVAQYASLRLHELLDDQ